MPDRDDRASAREDLCRFLAACYYQPDPAFAEEKLFDSLLDAASRVDPELAAQAHRLREAFANDGQDRMLIDYARLFLGPTQAIAQPYGSVWLSGEKTLMGETTMAVQRLYEEGGFEIDASFPDLPDHIAVELEFLYLLLFRENRARRAGEAEAVASAASLRKRFLDGHLGRWVGPFTNAMSAGAGSAFYRELASFTERFVGLEAAAP